MCEVLAILEELLPIDLCKFIIIPYIYKDTTIDTIRSEYLDNIILQLFGYIIVSSNDYHEILNTLKIYKQYNIIHPDWKDWELLEFYCVKYFYELYQKNKLIYDNYFISLFDLILIIPNNLILISTHEFVIFLLNLNLNLNKKIQMPNFCDSINLKNVILLNQ